MFVQRVHHTSSAADQVNASICPTDAMTTVTVVTAAMNSTAVSLLHICKKRSLRFFLNFGTFLRF